VKLRPSASGPLRAALCERVARTLVISIKKVWKELAVSDYYFEKRFGKTAVEIGFITAAQLGDDTGM
jgi:hypothetical protein